MAKTATWKSVADSYQKVECICASPKMSLYYIGLTENLASRAMAHRCNGLPHFVVLKGGLNLSVGLDLETRAQRQVRAAHPRSNVWKKYLHGPRYGPQRGLPRRAWGGSNTNPLAQVRFLYMAFR